MKINIKPFRRALNYLHIPLIAGLMSLSASAETLKPNRADAIRLSIGVNTHVNYTDGAYAQLPFVIDALTYLGVTHVRDLSPTPWIHGAAPLSAYTRVMDYGIKFTFGDYWGSLDPSVMLDQLTALEKAHPGGVAAIEGFNEVDRNPIKYKGLEGLPAARAYQKDMYLAVKSNPVFKDTPVFDFTGDDIVTPAPPGGIGGRADYLNFHIYPQNGGQPRTWFAGVGVATKAYGLPIVVTEYGYASYPQSGWLNIGVDEPSQAKGILNSIFDSYDLGAERSFVYELVDQKPDPTGKVLEMHYGLFDNKFRKKIIARAMHNLTGTLRDIDPKALTFETRPLTFELKGLPSETAHYMLAEKATGETWLILWNESPIWDRAAGKPVAETRIPVELSLKGGARAVSIYDTLNLKMPVKPLKPSSELSLTLVDHPIMIRIER